MAKKSLGRGLEAILNEVNDMNSVKENERVANLAISNIEPNPNQARRIFNVEGLGQLADSIREHGIIQPIVVRDEGNGFYMIIAGERRWRAAKLVGLKTVPVVVKDYSDLEMMEISLIENLQREDLNPMEESNGYKSLMDNFHLTQDKVSQKVGKSRSAIANSLRLLVLDEKTQQLVKNNDISAGAARALLAVSSEENRYLLAKRVIDEDLSVRDIERIAKEINSGVRKRGSSPQTPIDDAIYDVEQLLTASLSAKVKIINGRKKGKIQIEYFGNDDLERILALIGNKS